MSKPVPPLVPFALTLMVASCAPTSSGGGAGVSSPNVGGAEPLVLEPYNPGDKALFPVSSVIVSGQRDVVLIDAQLARSDAQKLVEKIKASGKHLTTIYISHGDPDYYFGLDVLGEAFPSAAIVATEPTVNHIKETQQRKLAYWGPILKENAPGHVIVPRVLAGDRIVLEGHELVVVGLTGPAPERTCVWIPSLQAIVGGVVLFSGLHVWMTDTEAPGARAHWLALLDQLEQMGPKVVVPGHYQDGSKLDVSGIRFTRDYIKTFDAEAQKAQSSTELIAAMDKRYPTVGLKLSLEFSSKVAKREMTWE